MSEAWNKQPNPSLLVNILEVFTGALGQSSCRSWTRWIRAMENQRLQIFLFQHPRFNRTTQKYWWNMSSPKKNGPMASMSSNFRVGHGPSQYLSSRQCCPIDGLDSNEVVPRRYFSRKLRYPTKWEVRKIIDSKISLGGDCC